MEVNEESSLEKFETPLYVAAKKQTPEIVELLLDHGAEINALSHGWMPALMAAVVHGQIDNCKVLLKHGADASIRTNTAESTLELAVTNQKPDVGKLLLDHGIDVCSKSRTGSTMLDVAIMIGNADEKWIGDMKMRRVIEAFSNVKLDIMRLLIDYGIDVNTRDVDDAIGFHTAALVGDVEPVKILLDTGADSNLVDMYSWKPLWSAVRHNNVDIVRLLLPRTTDGNEQIYNGLTCLSSAAKLGNKESVEVLLEAGAEIWSREPGPGFLAPERRLLWYGIDTLAFMVFEDEGNDDTVRLILAAGAERPTVEPDDR